MKNSFCIATTAIAFAIALTASSPVLADMRSTYQDSTRVLVSPVEKIVDVGEGFVLTIDVDSLYPVDSLHSYFFSIEVDRNVIELDFAGTERGDFFSQFGSGYFFVNDTSYYFRTSPSDSELVDVYDVFDALFGSSFASGHGDLAKVGFTTVGSGLSLVKFRITYMDDIRLRRIAVVDSLSGLVLVCPVDDLWGDINGSAGIDIDDIVYLIDYVFTGGSPPVPHVLVGDVNCSKGVDIDDIVYLISYVFSGGTPPCDPCNEWR